MHMCMPLAKAGLGSPAASLDSSLNIMFIQFTIHHLFPLSNACCKLFHLLFATLSVQGAFPVTAVRIDNTGTRKC